MNRLRIHLIPMCSLIILLFSGATCHSYTITINPRPADGTVKSSIGGIDCGYGIRSNVCTSTSINAGTTVKLTAVPRSINYEFEKWTIGQSDSTENPYSAQMPAQNVTGSVSFAYRPPVDGSCGAINNLSSMYVPPETSLCSVGFSSNFTCSSGSWNWLCNGYYGGVASACVASVAAPLYSDNPFQDDYSFVRRTYLDFLNREPDKCGGTYWITELYYDRISNSQIVDQFMLSPEFGEKVSPVVRLYFAYFNRLPDYAGLMYWMNEYASGNRTLDNISDFFAASPEFLATYGNLSNSQFVDRIYTNLFNRTADLAGKAFWTNELDSGSRTRGQVMVGFSESQEYKDLMTNPIYVTMTYVGLLRRAPDFDGYNYWVDRMDQGDLGLVLIDLFLNSPEYAARFAEYTRPNAPSNLVASNITQISASVSWQDNSDNETYFMIGTHVPVIGFNQLATANANVKSIDLSGLSVGTTYTVYVVACNGAGCNESIGVTFTTSTIPQYGEIAIRSDYDNVIMKDAVSPVNNDTVFNDSYLTIGTNYGYNAWQGTVTQDWASLIHFDVGQLSGKIIDSAVFEVEARSVGVGAYPKDWIIQVLATPWEHNSVTWNNYMLSHFIYPPDVARLLPPAYSGQVYQVDLTAVVQKWVDGSYQNNGLMLKSVNYIWPEYCVYGICISLDFYDFYNHNDQASPPKLIVNYH